MQATLEKKTGWVSRSRISHIQRAIETGTPGATVQQVLLEYKVKN